MLMLPLLSPLFLFLILPRHEPLIQERYENKHRGEADERGHAVELAEPPEVHKEDLDRGPDHQDQRGPAHLTGIPFDARQGACVLSLQLILRTSNQSSRHLNSADSELSSL